MGSETARFDPASEQFIGYYDTVRGHVRQEVTRHNLVASLPGGRALWVLDFGGGDARDTIWQAGMGDEVMLLDESPEMLEQAEDAIRQEKIAVKRHITLRRGGLESLDNNEIFDVILCHGVLMYELEGPVGQLQALSRHLRPDGILSLLTKGSEAARVCAEDPEQAAHFNEEGHYVNRLGLPSRVYNFEELEAMTFQADLQTVGRYGVRLLSDDDRRPLDEVPERELNKIIEREIEASRDSDRMNDAQMLHLIARKN